MEKDIKQILEDVSKVLNNMLELQKQHHEGTMEIFYELLKKIPGREIEIN